MIVDDARDFETAMRVEITGTGPITVTVVGRKDELVGSFRGPGAAKRCARATAAGLLGYRSLRGLRQCVTADGIRWYAPGADDYDGETVEVAWI